MTPYFEVEKKVQMKFASVKDLESAMAKFVAWSIMSNVAIVDELENGKYVFAQIVDGQVKSRNVDWVSRLTLERAYNKTLAEVLNDGRDILQGEIKAIKPASAELDAKLNNLTDIIAGMKQLLYPDESFTDYLTGSHNEVAAAVQAIIVECDASGGYESLEQQALRAKDTVSEFINFKPSASSSLTMKMN